MSFFCFFVLPPALHFFSGWPPSSPSRPLLQLSPRLGFFGFSLHLLLFFSLPAGPPPLVWPAPGQLNFSVYPVPGHLPPLFTLPLLVFLTALWSPLPRTWPIPLAASLSSTPMIGFATVYPTSWPPSCAPPPLSCYVFAGFLCLSFLSSYFSPPAPPSAPPPVPQAPSPPALPLSLVNALSSPRLTLRLAALIFLLLSRLAATLHGLAPCPLIALYIACPPVRGHG